MPLNLPHKRGPWTSRMFNENFQRISRYLDGALTTGSGTAASSEIGGGSQYEERDITADTGLSSGSLALDGDDSFTLTEGTWLAQAVAYLDNPSGAMEATLSIEINGTTYPAGMGVNPADASSVSVSALFEAAADDVLTAHLGVSAGTIDVTGGRIAIVKL